MKKRKRIPPGVYDTKYLLSDYLEGYEQFKEEKLSVVKTRQLNMLKLGPGLTFLEVGIGRGEVLLHCARTGAKVAGIDYSEDAIHIARELMKEYPDADIRLADCSSLPYEDSRFDRVFSGDVVEHLDYFDAIRMLEEMKRLLKPAGFMLVHTSPNTVWSKMIYPVGKPFLKMLDKKTVEQIDNHIREGRKMHVYEHNLLSLRRVAREAGLRNARVWLDPDILRQGKHRFTSAFSGNFLVRRIVALGTIPLVRFCLSNDLWLEWHKPT